MNRLLRELRKYARQERVLLCIYAGWMVLMTYCQATSLAIVSPNSGIRAASQRLAECQDWITMVLIIGVTLRVFSSDPLYNANAFWRLRPIREATLLGAKGVLLVLIACVTPALVEVVTLHARGSSSTTLLTNTPYTGLWYLAMAAPFAAIALLLHRWEEIAFALGLLTMGSGFHFLAFAMAGHDSSWTRWFYPLGFVITLGLTALVALRARRATEPVFTMLLGFVIFVPLVVFLSKPILSLRKPAPLPTGDQPVIVQVALSKDTHLVSHGVAIRVTNVRPDQATILLQAPADLLPHLTFCQDVEGERFIVGSYRKRSREILSPFPRPIVRELKVKLAAPDSPLLLVADSKR